MGSSYSEEYDKLINLLNKEKEVDMVDEELEQVLGRISLTNMMYKQFTNKEKNIKNEVIRKNRKELIIRTLFLMMTTGMFFWLVKINLSELFKLLPTLFHVIYGVLIGMVVVYEGVLCFKDCFNEEKLCAELEDNEEYQEIVQKIKTMAKEKKELSLKRIGLERKKEDLVLEVQNLHQIALMGQYDVDKMINVMFDQSLDYDRNREIVRRRIKDK